MTCSFKFKDLLSQSGKQQKKTDRIEMAIKQNDISISIWISIYLNDTLNKKCIALIPLNC